MEHIFITRPGTSYLDRLTKHGKSQLDMLGNIILKNTGSFYLVTSSSPLALESASILAKKLAHKDYEKIEYLWGGRGAPKGTFYSQHNKKRLLDILYDNDTKVDNLVVLTHRGIDAKLVEYFFDMEYGREAGITDSDSLAGNLFHIDIAKETIQRKPKRLPNQ